MTPSASSVVLTLCAGFLVALGASCTVDVTLEGGCVIGGEVYGNGEVLPSGLCEVCTCQNGASSCATVDVVEPSSGVCCFRGREVPESESVADPCSVCKCLEDGTLSCVDICACEDPVPECPSTEACRYAPVCTPTGWSCEGNCSCTEPSPGCPMPPPGCYWITECTDQGWSCGGLVCECAMPGDPTFCPTPPPGCYVVGEGCDELGQWSCGTIVCDSCGSMDECDVSAECQMLDVGLVCSVDYLGCGFCIPYDPTGCDLGDVFYPNGTTYYEACRVCQCNDGMFECVDTGCNCSTCSEIMCGPEYQCADDPMSGCGSCVPI